ncbi:MAG TPA: SRPBCC domain-containing protein [Chitinophagaceae bacterium]
MSDDKLEIKASLMISKPVLEVFEAIVDPEKMSNYFISKSSGRMEEGKTLVWEFPEMDMQFPVYIKKIEPDNYISFNWKDFRDGTETLVEFTLTQKPNATFVTVTEKSRDNDETGMKWLKSNIEGWANFLACLKAYMEYGINLRKGAFDPSQMPKKEN